MDANSDFKFFVPLVRHFQEADVILEIQGDGSHFPRVLVTVSVGQACARKISLAKEYRLEVILSHFFVGGMANWRIFEFRPNFHFCVWHFLNLHVELYLT